MRCIYDLLWWNKGHPKFVGLLLNDNQGGNDGTYRDMSWNEINKRRNTFPLIEIAFWTNCLSYVLRTSLWMSTLSCYPFQLYIELSLNFNMSCMYMLWALLGSCQLALDQALYMKASLNIKPTFKVQEQLKWQFEDNTKPSTIALKTMNKVVMSELLQLSAKWT